MAAGMSQVSYDVFALKGGLDLVTPTMSLPPGVARDAGNMEVSITGGFSRIYGYERYDGTTPNPSEATFASVTVNTLGAITVGTTINNGTGGTGLVFLVDGLVLYYTNQVGAINLGDVLNGTSTVTAAGPSLTPAERSVKLGQVADYIRSLKTVVPGSGDVRGVAWYGSALYAWRNNAGNTALTMWKATSGGWTQQLYPFELSFTASGTTPIVAGNAIANGLGVTGTVAVVVIQTGTWAAGTASGRLILSASSAAWTAANNIQVGGVTRATVVPPVGTATFLAGARTVYVVNGRVETFESNFGGATVNKLYGADGVNPAFEFDGTTVVPIRTGMTNDTPTHVVVHKNYLWLSFINSLQFSALANPHSWAPLLGAGELVMPAPITNLIILPGDQTAGALGVLTEDDTAVVYGSIASGTGADMKLTSFNSGVGAYGYTAQNMDQVYSLADRGVSSVAATLNFGNFDTKTLTFALRPFVQARRGLAVSSALNRERSQYRVFFTDGTGLYLTINNGKYLGAMPVQFPNPVLCWCPGALGTTREVSFFGSSDGYVRRMDAGTSFDGAAIDSRIILNFDHMGNPRVLKRFRKAAFEVSADAYTSFNSGYSLAYADAIGKDQASYAPYSSNFAPGTWDSGFLWDAGLYWDGQTLGPVEIEVQGSGENIAIAFNSSTATDAPFTINTITVHYTPRRGLR